MYEGHTQTFAYTLCITVTPLNTRDRGYFYKGSFMRQLMQKAALGMGINNPADRGISGVEWDASSHLAVPVHRC